MEQIEGERSFGFVQVVELSGHIVDSFRLGQLMDTVMDLGGDFEVEQFDLGKHKTAPSYARIRIMAPSAAVLGEILERAQRLGATYLREEDATTEPAPRDGVFPLTFYSTTNLKTDVRFDGRWLPVELIEMDCGIVYRQEEGRALCIPVSRVRQGDRIVVGHAGIKIEPPERPRQHEIFSFMGSAVSSERPKELAVAELAAELRAVKERGGKILFVGGPAIAHTGGGPYLSRLIELGYIDVLFAGNALATHDIESALYGTSLGVSLKDGLSADSGHEHHIRAINFIRYHGSIRAAVEAGALTSGVMYTCVTKNVPFVLAGSIRDDGPLPDVITDVIEAQETMRS